MAITNITAKLIEKKRFSNKAYSIDVKLYEHNMARVDVNCKKRFRGRKWHGGYIPFDACITEAVYDYVETLERMDVDKRARRWLRKVMLHCVDGLTKPNGRMDWEKVNTRHDEVSHRSYVSLQLSVAHLQIIKRYIPDIFIAGNYRTDYMLHNNVKRIGAEEDGLFPPLDRIKYEKGRKHHERRLLEACFYAPKAKLLNMTKELSKSFYKKIGQERTLDDCSIRMEYVWFHGKKPELSISVCDKTYTNYSMPY